MSPVFGLVSVGLESWFKRTCAEGVVDESAIMREAKGAKVMLVDNERRRGSWKIRMQRQSTSVTNTHGRVRSHLHCRAVDRVLQPSYITIG